MADNGYDLGSGFIQATVSFDGVGREIGREMRNAARKEGVAGGREIGKRVREGIEKETAKVDLGAYETAVKGAEQRIAKHAEDSSKRVEAAKRKVAIAEAKVAEALESHEEGSAKALEATDRLIAAQEKLAATQESVTSEAEGLNSELKKQESLLLAASTAGQKTAVSYRASFGRRLTQGISGAITTAFRGSGVAAAAAAGALAGTAYGKSFKSGLDRQNIGGHVAATLAKISGLRAVGDFAEQLGDAFSDMDRNVVSLANLGLKVGVLGSVAVAATGGIAGLATGIGRMVSAGLALPGIIAGVVGGVVIFNQAWKDAATVMADVVEAYGGVQDAISNAFWARAEGPLRSIAYTLLPIVRDGAAAVAHELGGWAVAISGALSDVQSLTYISAGFEWMRQAADTAGDGIGAMTQGLVGLGAVGMSYLPRLASAFNSLSYSFQGWVEENIANENLWRWINSGIVEMKALGSVLASTGGIIGAVADAARAAGGATGFAGLAAGMNYVEAALKSPVWQGAMTTVFRGAYEGLGYIADGVKSLGPAFISVAPVLAEIMSLMGESFGAILKSVSDFIQHPAVQHGVLEFFSGVRNTIVDLAPTVGVMGDLFGALSSMAGQLVYAIGGTLDAALQAIGPAFVGISEGLRPLIPAVSSIAQSIINGAAPAFQTMGRILTDYVIPPVVSVFEWLSGFPGLLGGVGLIIAGVIGNSLALSAAAHGIGLALTGISLVGGLVSKALTGIKLAMIGVNFVMGLNPIAKVVLALSALVAGAVWAYNNIGWFKDAVNAVWDSIKVAAAWAWDGIKTVIGGFVNWLTDTVWPGIQSAADTISGAWSSVTGAASDAWGGIKSLIAGFVSWITTTVVPGVQTALAAVGSVFSWLNTNILQPIWYGMRFSAALVGAAILTVVDGIVWAFNNTLAPAFTWLKDSVVVPVWEGIRTAISAAWTWIRDSVLIPLGRFLRDNVGAAWDWLRTKVTGVWEGIKGAVSRAWAWVRDVVMIPLGRFLRDNVGAAWQWLRDKVAAVWNGIKTAVSTAWAWVRDAVLIPLGRFLRETVGGAWQWLRDKVSAVWGGIKTAVSTAWNWVRNSVLTPAVTFVRGSVVSSWTFLRDTVARVWDGIKRTISDTWSWVKTHVIDPMVNAVKNTAVSAFETARDGIRTAWNAIKRIVGKPVEFVINTVIRDGFVKHFNTIAEKFKIDTIDFKGVNLTGYARGGVLPGYESRKRDTMLTPMRAGEGVLVPEAVRGLGAGFIHGVNAAANAGGVSAARRWAAENGTAAGTSSRWKNPAQMAVGSPVYGGVGSFSNPLQRSIYRTGVLNVNPVGDISGFDLTGAISMLDAATSVNVRKGKNPKYAYGDNTVHVHKAPRPEWWGGYYQDNMVMLNTRNTTHMNRTQKRTLLGHELGHALGLPHSARMHGGNGAQSIMNYDNQYQHNSVTAADVAALAAIYGGSGVAGKGSGGGFLSSLVSGLFDTIGFDKLLPKIPGGGIASDVMKGAAKTAWEGFKSYAADVLNPFDNGGDDTGDVERWRGTVVDALKRVGLPTSNSYVEAWLRQIQSESNGNPRAVQGNIGDINNLTGDLGKGLVQVIGSTFAAHRDVELPNDQFHPLANLVAGMRYAKSRYGVESMLQVIGKGHGYSRGGVVQLPRPELHDHGGVLRPGISWVENRTGQDEAILNPSQLATVNRSIEVVDKAAERGGGVNFYAPVTVADPDELWETQKKKERWEAALHAA